MIDLDSGPFFWDGETFPAIAGFPSLVTEGEFRACCCSGGGCEVTAEDLVALSELDPIAIVQTAFTLESGESITRMCRRLVLYCYDAAGVATATVVGNNPGVSVSLSDAGYLELAEAYRTAAAPNKKEIVAFIFLGLRARSGPAGTRTTTGSTTDYEVYRLTS